MFFVFRYFSSNFQFSVRNQQLKSELVTPTIIPSKHDIELSPRPFQVLLGSLHVAAAGSQSHHPSRGYILLQ